MTQKTPLLHRDNPDKDPLVGHVKVTREDWLNLARVVLIQKGVAEVKILALSQRLEVSRSSFYSYFQDRQDLLAALLADWEARNTQTIVAYCARPARAIDGAVCNFFRCFLDPDLFDQGLDFAVREWARRDAAVRTRIEAADAQRLKALQALFLRYAYSAAEAETRARILYYMQLGYHALDVREDLDLRLSRTAGYLEGFTGVPPDPETVAGFEASVRALRGLKDGA